MGEEEVNEVDKQVNDQAKSRYLRKRKKQVECRGSFQLTQDVDTEVTPQNSSHGSEATGVKPRK